MLSFDAVQNMVAVFVQVVPGSMIHNCVTLMWVHDVIIDYTDYPSLHIQECPQGSPSFRSQQCTATNNRPFNGVLHTWLEFIRPGDHNNYK